MEDRTLTISGSPCFVNCPTRQCFESSPLALVGGDEMGERIQRADVSCRAIYHRGHGIPPCRRVRNASPSSDAACSQ